MDFERSDWASPTQPQLADQQLLADRRETNCLAHDSRAITAEFHHDFGLSTCGGGNSVTDGVSSRFMSAAPIVGAFAKMPLSYYAREQEEFPGYGHFQQNKRKQIYLAQKQEWDIFESAGSIAISAHALKKLGIDLIFAGKISAAQKASMRSQAMAGSFTAVAAATIASCILDRLIVPDDQKMEATTIADWLVVPALAISPMRFWTRFALVSTTHATGRLIDHFRQPPQTF